MKRAVILFPRFNNIDIVNNIRGKYDPLANYIAPHITIIFPFESDLKTHELKEHFNKSLIGMKNFRIMLKGITGDYRDGYLFLNVKKGNDNIIELHDKLYSGVLEKFLFRKVTYCPHLTVGRVFEEKEFDNAVDELSCYNENFEAVRKEVRV
ncbi:2'-5' RNA ligase family protein [Clostridium sp.]|uniref:2'-5' RNA ligase family protein n=1 Tax=Clostridium sp. TaxID=1506 RepID=UPI001A447E22|nr:2'-5' RNA ligase family protein [Clostridium sp.]MBK5237467.1 2'-5' RNA ligase family protein [Clostridium sp.]